MLDTSTALKQCIGDSLRLESLVERRTHIVCHLRQHDERWQFRAGAPTNGRLDLSRVHVGEPEQNQH
ncbi:hypothetical protein ACIGB6_15780 [Paeniglutamicibacter gangotriensis]|uniref:Uncharacterized protein n=1 Tax=Paeniglutamicibacter gangotriensis Lz1y TaxID=1276920 RepID=M7NFU6_9MICC|nr:hypothetical protein [Paeniglutamicibacter gangotriensis]EMQ97368.1 hypothetical protein ADIAG_03163 [Paeniglutamicibacter gangotriensis Lz1y]